MGIQLRSTHDLAAPVLPGPGALHPLITLGRLIDDPLRFLTQLAGQYGDQVFFNLGKFPVCLINHPDLVEEALVQQADKLVKGRLLERTKRVLGEGLLTSEGDFHKRQRKLIQPAFHRQRLQGYAEVMATAARRTAEGWRDGQELDLAEALRTLTLEIVARTLFATDIHDRASTTVGEALETFQRAFSSLLLPLPDGLLEWLPTPGAIRFRRARRQLDQLILELIAERRRLGDQGDLLSMLLAAQDEQGEGMPDRQIRDEALTLFLAGHETTANALAFTFGLLAQHPEIATRVAQEATEAWGEGTPSYGHLERLPYTRQVFAEAMRLYPPAWAIGRRAVADLELGGYTVPAQTVVVCSQFLLHRRSDFFPEPEKFDPTRFAPGQSSAWPKFAYMPFGAGPRLCIGLQFAWLEGILLTAVLAQRWQPELLGTWPPRLQPSITLRPADGLRVRLHARVSGAFPPS